MLLGKTLKQILERKSISIKKLSEDTGIGLSTIKDWANGASPRDLDGLRTVSRYLGVSLEFLIWGTEDDRPHRSPEEILAETIFDGCLKVSVSRVMPVAKTATDHPDFYFIHSPSGNKEEKNN